MYQLKKDFPELEIIINGGVKSYDEIDAQLQHVDGVMIGREAYHNPWIMAAFDERYYGDEPSAKTRIDVVEAMLPYIERELAAGGPRLNSIVRHMLGLMTGLRGARQFRQTLSDSKLLANSDPGLLLRAAQALPLAA